MTRDLNLDKFVDDAIKVEEGEIETLRPPPIEPSDIAMESPVTYADEDYGNNFVCLIDTKLFRLQNRGYQ